MVIPTIIACHARPADPKPDRSLMRLRGNGAGVKGSGVPADGAQVVSIAAATSGGDYEWIASS